MILFVININDRICMFCDFSAIIWFTIFSIIFRWICNFYTKGIRFLCYIFYIDNNHLLSFELFKKEDKRYVMEN